MSGFDPPGTDRTYAGTKIWWPKTNQIPEMGDWRFFPRICNNPYSPKWIPGLHLGHIRWLHMHGAMFENRYWWISGSKWREKINWFPMFSDYLRKMIK